MQRIISILCEKGYLKEAKKSNEFTADVRQAVISFQADNGLECTGWMDDETLNELLDGILPDESERWTLESWYDICYLPTDGGQKYHASPLCSDMLNPRMVTRINASRLGITHCRKNTCKREPNQLSVYAGLALTPRVLPDDYYLTEEEEQELHGNKPSEPVQATEVTRSIIEDQGVVYIGNKNSKTFHLSTCRSAKSMSDKNRVEFSSREEAIGQGYKPCGSCHP